MNENKIMLTDEQMANFTAKGYLKLDSVIPEEIINNFLMILVTQLMSLLIQFKIIIQE
jgi:hypothetical protein